MVSGINGFECGLNAKKYINITKTSRATATCDLQELVKKNAFYQTGSGKGTHYYIKNMQMIHSKIKQPNIHLNEESLAL